MKEIISTVTSKGQVTIPAEIRKYLGITTNDKISFVIDDEGAVRLRVHRYPTMASLRGAAGRLNKPLSWQDMQKQTKNGEHVVRLRPIMHACSA